MKYEYKQIPSFPNFEICDYAPIEFCVRSIKTKEYCKVKDNGIGYPKVYFSKRNNGDGKQYYLHRLVAETYIGKIPKGMECDHCDTCPEHYNHLNLRICTSKENSNNLLTKQHYSEAQIRYFSKLENRKKASESHNFQKKIVQQIDKNTGEVLNEYFGLHEAERKTGYFRQGIIMCCRGKFKTYKGYIWKYKE